MAIKKFMIATAFAAGLATGTSAATLSGSTGGSFSATPSGTNSCVFNGGSSVAWGDPNTCPDTNGIAQDDSTLSILNVSFDEEISAATKVQIGQFDWFNEANTHAVDFAAIGTISLTFTTPFSGPFSEDLEFDITNTPNNPADIILAMTFSDFGLTLPASAGGITLNGFSFGLISPISGETLSVGPSPSGGGVALRWVNPEHNTSSLAVYVHVAPVPLPAAGWLMIAGLGGLTALRRRRKES